MVDVLLVTQDFGILWLNLDCSCWVQRSTSSTGGFWMFVKFCSVSDLSYRSACTDWGKKRSVSNRNFWAFYKAGLLSPWIGPALVQIQVSNIAVKKSLS